MNLEETKTSAEFTHLKFHGQGGEYFKIWIVNLLLTVLTFGIYSPWAKIRKMKYMNQSTEFKGSRMDYHAEPIPILIGRIIAILLFAVYFWSGQINWAAGLLGLIVVVLVIPFLFVKSIRFKAKNTSYRNIRFGFRGTIQDAYHIWFRYGAFYFALTAIAILSLRIFGNVPSGAKGAALLRAQPAIIIPLVIGLINLIYTIKIAPHFLSAIYNYFYNNLYYGNAKVSIHANPDSVSEHIVGPYLKAVGMFILYIIGFILFAALLGLISKSKALLVLLVPMAFGIYGFLFYMSLLFPFLTLLFVWNRLGILNYKSKITLSKSDFIGLAFTNLLAMGFSFGLLIPWAQIRYRKLVTEAKAFNIDDLDQFTAASSSSDSPIGDEIMDIFDFDFEIGL